MTYRERQLVLKQLRPRRYTTGPASPAYPFINLSMFYVQPKKAKKGSRGPNSFMIFANEIRPSVMAENPGNLNPSLLYG